MKYIQAKNELCLLALLEMVIDDTGHHLSQEQLAELFGVTVYTGTQMKIMNVTYSDCDREIGVHVDAGKLRKLFHDYDVPLDVQFFPSNPYDNYGVDLIYPKLLNHQQYMIFTYSYGKLFGKPDLDDVGHVALLEKVVDDRTVEVFDPGPRDSGFKTIDLMRMYEAIEYRDGGTYLFVKSRVSA